MEGSHDARGGREGPGRSQAAEKESKEGGEAQGEERQGMGGAHRRTEGATGLQTEQVMSHMHDVPLDRARIICKDRSIDPMWRD